MKCLTCWFWLTVTTLLVTAHVFAAQSNTCYEIIFRLYGPQMREEVIYERSGSVQRRVQTRIYKHFSNELMEIGFIQKNGKWREYNGKGLASILREQTEVVDRAKAPKREGDVFFVRKMDDYETGEVGDPVLLNEEPGCVLATEKSSAIPETSQPVNNGFKASGVH